MPRYDSGKFIRTIHEKIFIEKEGGSHVTAIGKGLKTMLFKIKCSSNASELVCSRNFLYLAFDSLYTFLYLSYSKSIKDEFLNRYGHLRDH